MALTTAYIGLGSNLGNRLAYLQEATKQLCAAAVEIRCSPVYRSAAHTLHPDERQPWYLNAVLEIKANMDAEALLCLGQHLELQAGRRRTRKYAPRTLDVDVLDISECSQATARLQVPHPRLAERRFVLQPWADLAPYWYIDTPFTATVAELLGRCTDPVAPVRMPWSLSPATESMHT